MKQQRFTVEKPLCFKPVEQVKKSVNSRPNHKDPKIGEGWHAQMERSNAAATSAINRHSPGTYSKERNA